MSKEITRNLTSYDFLKMAAVLLMFVDHVGDYFFHDELWLRVIGRFCVPIWFFLIGYARSRDIGVKLWGWMTVLAIVELSSGLGVFAVNILLTMILIRVSIDPIMQRTSNDESAFWGIVVTLLCLSIPSAMFFEYGTLGFLIAIFGYWVRLKQDGAERYGAPVKATQVQTYMIFATFSFVFIQYMTFGFSQNQFFVLAGSITVIMMALSSFKMVEYAKLTQAMPRLFVWIVQIFGRHTMEIYVIHLILLNIVALSIGLRDDFELFRFTWFPHGVAESLGFGADITTK